MNMQSIIVLVVVAIWVILAIRYTRKNGIGSCGGSCNGDCAHCGSCSHCRPDGDKSGQ